jgi:hypothetical protein
MQLVSFWLVAVSFLGTAFVQARAANMAVIATGVCATGMVSCTAFAALDARTRRLIRVAEEALRQLEQRRLKSGVPAEILLVIVAHTARTSRIASYRLIIEGLQLLVAALFAAGGAYSVISI